MCWRCESARGSGLLLLRALSVELVGYSCNDSGSFAWRPIVCYPAADLYTATEARAAVVVCVSLGMQERRGRSRQPSRAPANDDPSVNAREVLNLLVDRQETQVLLVDCQEQE